MQRMLLMDIRGLRGVLVSVCSPSLIRYLGNMLIEL